MMIKNFESFILENSKTWAEKYIEDKNPYKKLQWYVYMSYNQNPNVKYVEKNSEKNINGIDYIFMGDGSVLKFNKNSNDWELDKKFLNEQQSKFELDLDDFSLLADYEYNIEQSIKQKSLEQEILQFAKILIENIEECLKVKKDKIYWGVNIDAYSTSVENFMDAFYEHLKNKVKIKPKQIKFTEPWQQTPQTLNFWNIDGIEFITWGDYSTEFGLNKNIAFSSKMAVKLFDWVELNVSDEF